MTADRGATGAPVAFKRWVTRFGVSTGSAGGGVSTLQGDPGTVLPPVSDTVDYDVYANPAGTPYTGNLELCGVAVDYRLAAT